VFTAGSEARSHLLIERLRPRARVTRVDIDIRPIDVPCVFPKAWLVPYLRRIGPVGRVLSEADDETRAKVVAAVMPAFDPFVCGDEVRFCAACWMAGAKATCAN
jgi:hypothetical protein